MCDNFCQFRLIPHLLFINMFSSSKCNVQSTKNSKLHSFTEPETTNNNEQQVNETRETTQAV